MPLTTIQSLRADTSKCIEIWVVENDASLRGDVCTGGVAFTFGTTCMGECIVLLVLDFPRHIFRCVFVSSKACELTILTNDASFIVMPCEKATFDDFDG